MGIDGAVTRFSLSGTVLLCLFLSQQLRRGACSIESIAPIVRPRGLCAGAT